MSPVQEKTGISGVDVHSVIDLICRGMTIEDALLVSSILKRERFDSTHPRSRSDHQQIIRAFRRIPMVSDAETVSIPHLKRIENLCVSSAVQTHRLPLANVCPITREPKEGYIDITYSPAKYHLDIVSLPRYLSQFQGGWRRWDLANKPWEEVVDDLEATLVQGLEMVISVIQKDCQHTLEVPVTVQGAFKLYDPRSPEQPQELMITCPCPPSLSQPADRSIGIP